MSLGRLALHPCPAKEPSIWADVQSTLSGLWSENVLNMTLDRQEQSIYKPIRELAYSLSKFVQQLITSPKSALPNTLWDFADGPRTLVQRRWRHLPIGFS